MAPITPFITEELYQKYFRKNEGDKSIHISSWPEEIDIKSGENDGEIWKKLLEIIEKVRKAKSEAKKSMKAEIILTLENSDYKALSAVLPDLKAVTSSKEIKQGKFNIEIL